MKRVKSSLSVQRGNSLHYLRLYINLCYYLGIFPYKIIYDDEERKYVLHTNRVQKAFCVLTTIFCICEETYTLRRTIFHVKEHRSGAEEDPMIYFEMIKQASDFLYYCTVFRTLWFKSEQMLGVIQYLHLTGSESMLYSHRTTNVKARIFVTFSILPFLIYPSSFIAGFFIDRAAEWNSTQVIDYWAKGTSKVFFIDDYFHTFPYIFVLGFAILRNFFLIGYTQITTSMEMLLINTGMLFFDTVQDFSQVIQNAEGLTGQELLVEYAFLRNLSRKVNKAVGFLTFGLTLLCLPYYVTNLIEFINPPNGAVFVRHLLFFTNSFGFVFLAAEVNKKAHLLEEWLVISGGRNFADLPTNSLNILLYDLSQRNVGFNGSGFFKITPSFLGTIISLLLTFSIIIIQFQNSGSAIIPPIA